MIFCNLSVIFWKSLLRDAAAADKLGRAGTASHRAAPGRTPKWANMTTHETSAIDAEGYWTIQIIHRDRDRIGKRYACHARDDLTARGIASHLAGSGRDVTGYDYFRFDNPQGQFACALELGQSQPIDDPAAWTALQAARRMLRV